jgi:hypothetical protein
MQLACHEYMARVLLFLMLITGSLLTRGLANANPFSIGGQRAYSSAAHMASPAGLQLLEAHTCDTQHANAAYLVLKRVAIWEWFDTMCLDIRRSSGVCVRQFGRSSD